MDNNFSVRTLMGNKFSVHTRTHYPDFNFEKTIKISQLK